MEVYKVDTHFPGSQNRSLVVVLYGELGTPEFSLFHQILKQKAQDGLIDYVIRHYVKVGRFLRLFARNKDFSLGKAW